MEVKITVNNSGSLRIEGDVKLFDASGSQYDLAGRTTIKLCRCGASQKKPFCDGMHRSVGFQSTCEAFSLPPEVK